jgi:hypothetical protein
MNTNESPQEQAAQPGGLPAASGYVVRVYVRGHLAGEIPHETAAAAYKDAQERREKFGALGCAYFVRPHTD